jgi:hypothetical protein
VPTLGLEKTLPDRSKPVALITDGSALTMISNSLKIDEFEMLTPTLILSPTWPVMITGLVGQNGAEPEAMQTVPTGAVTV